MYEQEGREFVAAAEDEDDEKFVVEKDKDLRETLVVFENNQFVIYDFMSGSSWNIGDVETGKGGYFTIAENSSIAQVIPGKHKTNAM